MSKTKPVREYAAPGNTAGKRGFEYFRAASERVREAQKQGYFLEAITLLESMLSERMEHRLGFFLRRRKAHVAARTANWNAKRLAGLLKLEKGFATLGELAAALREVEDDAALKLLVERIGGDVSWRERRNHALHGMVKRAAGDSRMWDERYAELEGVAHEGVQLLTRFDARDRELCHAGRGTKTHPSATCPDAFTPLGAPACEWCAKASKGP